MSSIASALAATAPARSNRASSSVCATAARASSSSARMMPARVVGAWRRASATTGGHGIAALRKRRAGTGRGRALTLQTRARVAGGDPGDTRLGATYADIARSFRDQVKKNFNYLPVALICLLVGFSMCAYFPHPESPGDAVICLTIMFLSEFLSSVLYSPKRPRGMLKWLREGSFIPLALNCFKIGVLYGLCCDAFKVGS
ncbi:uncharacterized protein MICPUCDRAFT_49861 [Micromonas pusilla CCMP1545]|uniref:Predicted protein n=1 Tax=Micromonas pusilla (strain CCMP1545) TaxID=564608 RepID=C1MGL7_MICPC|nr:uncharacterized protein MICPUCDRAFT_49861 [Micromonas pusilla CCMP1545]EEH60596.1 predicted protein [Micromonas pusilla CCMP1545]|eukprot:XP_003055344.1 predicted protein [Micromonas pusilla CCMP1545]